MNYGRVKDMTLKLLNQYSIAGNLVPTTYNNQDDYISRIPDLVNDAMMEIATTVRRIPAVLRLSADSGENLGEEIRYHLPADFFQFKSGDVVRTVDGRVLHTNSYSLLGEHYLVVPKTEVGDYELTYYRYPYTLSSDPKDTDELDNTPDTHFAIPYYVASMLVSGDDAFLCALFNNKFEDKLSKMLPDISAEAHQARDVYGGDFYNSLF